MQTVLFKSEVSLTQLHFSCRINGSVRCIPLPIAAAHVQIGTQKQRFPLEKPTERVKNKKLAHIYQNRKYQFLCLNKSKVNQELWKHTRAESYLARQFACNPGPKKSHTWKGYSAANFFFFWLGQRSNWNVLNNADLTPHVLQSHNLHKMFTILNLL